MRHAGPDALGALSGLPARLVAIEGLTEERPGACGLDVDVRLPGEANFSRRRLSDRVEQDDLFTRVEEELGATMPGR